jgi:hypothetical protein
LITGVRYNADRTGDRAEPCPMPTLVDLLSEENKFHRYLVPLLTK